MHILAISMERPQDQAGDATEHNALSSEAWDCWINEELKLDSESPMGTYISNSLWDDLAPNNESVARSLFACTPLMQMRASSSLGEQDSPQTSGSWHDPTFAAEGMLHLLVDENPNSSPCLSDSFEGRDGSFVNACEDLPSSSNCLWFMPNEESLSSSPHNEVEQSAESWMAGCFNAADTHTSRQGSMQHHANPINVAIRKISPTKEHGPACGNRCVKRGARPPSQEFLGSQHGVNTKKFAAPRGKQASRHTLVGSISDTQVMESSLKPIVYPFALVKPCGIQGDATLKDINQRINMSSAVKSPSGPSNTPSPSVSSPFSGKPVLAVTKIHTEGKGTITIMRTRS